MPVTLTDDQVATLRAQLEQGQRDKQIADFANSIWNDPALSDEAKALAKRKYPDATLPEYDLKREVFNRLDKDKEERETAAKDAREKERTEYYTKQKSEVQKRHSLTDDAMDRMEKEMNERKVYDYEVMAEHFVSREPKPIADTHNSRFWHHDRKAEFQEISKDPEGYAFNELVRAMQTDENTRRNR